MWKSVGERAVPILAGLLGASALAQEPAVPEPRAEAEAPADRQERLVDRAAAAALLSDLFGVDAADGAARAAGLSEDDLAALLRDFAGCEVIAGALLSDLARPAAESAELSPSASAQDPR